MRGNMLLELKHFWERAVYTEEKMKFCPGQRDLLSCNIIQCGSLQVSKFVNDKTSSWYNHTSDTSWNKFMFYSTPLLS